MSLLIKNIKTLIQTYQQSVDRLCGKEMNNMPSIDDAFVYIENDKIKSFGKMDDLNLQANDTIDASNKMVLPAFCDSHTHLVFAGSREQEFVDRINGLTYEQIAAKGGGILNSAKKLGTTSEEELLEQSLKRCNEIISQGTGAVEIKSGYGLSVESEIKILRVIKKLKNLTPLTIKATFLGAHAIPKLYKENREGYIDLIINEMLPIIANENLADFIDVFCETNYFTVSEMERIIEAGSKYNLQAKLHVNQFNSIGGIAAAVKHNALSVDHLEVITDEDIEALQSSNTISTLLPSCSFFIKIPYAPARKLIDKGLAIALASDYNPGSTPSGNMQLVISLACIKQNILPNEAVNAATLNGAYALGLSNKLGTITKGKHANLIITKPISSLAYVPYAFGSNLVDKMILNGKQII